jgi:hypothetical protein
MYDQTAASAPRSIAYLRSLRIGSTPLLVWLNYVAAISTGAAAALGIVLFLHTHLGDNQCVNMFMSRQLLRGVTPYGPQLQESNPPFVLWFSCIPVLLARAVHVSPVLGFQIFAIVVIGVVTLWSLSLFQRIVGTRGLLFWSFAFSLCFVTFDLERNVDFGEREHFLAVMLIPYLLLAVMRCVGRVIDRWETIAIGMVAAVGVCLKPQQIVIVFVTEAVILLWARRVGALRNPALIAFATAVVTYILAARLLAPLYFQHEIPLLLQVYWGLDAPYSALVRSASSMLVAIGGCITIYLRLWRFLQVPALPPVLAGSALAGVAVYVQEHKYFYYHAIPGRMYSLLLAMMLLAELVGWFLGEQERIDTSGVGWSATAACGFTFAVAALLGAMWMPHPKFVEPEKRFIADVLAPYPAGTVVGYLSPATYWQPAVLEQDKEYAMRYVYLWPLPALIISADPAPEYAEKRLAPAQVTALRRMLSEQMAEDLQRSKPPVVFVDDCEFPVECAALHREGYANLAAWFEENTEFRKVWSHYRFEKKGAGLGVYTRSDGAIGGSQAQLQQ